MKIKINSIITLLTIAVLSFTIVFALGTNSKQVSAQYSESFISESFDEYNVGEALDVSSKFQENWFTHSTTSPGKITVVNDPTNPSNKVASIEAGHYYNITPRNIVARNFTISYRVMPKTTIGTHWVGVLFRKQYIEDVNDPNKGTQLLAYTNFGKLDNKEIKGNFIQYKAPENTMHYVENYDSLIVSEGVKEKWFDIRYEVIEDFCYAYVNDYLIYVGQNDGITQAGYLSIHSLSINYLIDDIVIETEDKYSISVTTEKPNAGKISSNRSYANENSKIILSAVPNLGYEFVGWYENGELLSTELEYTITTETTSDRVFEAKWIATLYELSISSYDIGLGTFSQGGSYEAGTVLNIEAVANPGYKFAGWYKNDVFLSSATDYAYKTTAENAELKTKFVLEDAVSYTVKIHAVVNNQEIVGDTKDLITDAGKVSVVGQSQFFVGQKVAVQAVPEYKYSFICWKDYNTQETISEDETYIFDMEKPVELTAIFEDRLFEVEIINGVDKNTTIKYYKYGTNVDLTAELARTGYVFSTWSSSFDNINVLQNKVSFVVIEDMSIQAIYAKNKNNLSIMNNAKELGGESGGYALGAGKITYGETVTIKPVANKGFYFKGYELDGVQGELNEDGSITFVMPDNDVSIVLNFAKENVVDLKKDILGFTLIAAVVVVAACLVIFKKKAKD